MTALPEKLWHYTEKPLVLEPRAYEQKEPNKYGKPVGFWFSVEGEDDWPSWCISEDFCVNQLAYRTPVKIIGNVLCVTPETLPLFEHEHGFDLHFHQWTSRAIDWRRFAARYDGIAIAPYSWWHRLSSSWYYPWDCASGCIWNLDALAVGESEQHALPERVAT